MGPPATKKKAQLQTPPIFQRRTADTARPPSLYPRIEQAEDPEPQACGSDTQAVQLLFKTGLSAAVAKFARQLRDLGDRVDTLEQHSAAHAISLQDDQAQLNLQSQLLNLENKIEDLENRSRRGNLRLRGVPETRNLPVEGFNNVLLPTLPDPLFVSLVEEQRLCFSAAPAGDRTAQRTANDVKPVLWTPGRRDPCCKQQDPSALWEAIRKPNHRFYLYANKPDKMLANLLRNRNRQQTVYKIRTSDGRISSNPDTIAKTFANRNFTQPQNPGKRNPWTPT
ncbi:hypothetical protein XELAEV_18005972mg [Xenopus laevis]|uniref:Uncharacterized protein n=1 Tax=Xenopus laevis TaxID=8355 RepID=A0A974E0A8_XENLA|nr:hypothetical protein XELAEV_18005972mg [Xenopus laevis]